MPSLEKEAFFNDMAGLHLGLTYDDVHTQPGRNHMPAGEVDISSRFTRNVELKMPLVSAAMDTVTTSDMAIAIAKLGGIGVIHAGLTIEQQRVEARRVKKHLNGLIEEPITFSDDQSLENVLNTCQQKRYDFRTFPVTNNEGKFVGLLTSNDFDFPEDLRVGVDTAMTPEREITKAPAGTTVEEAYNYMRKYKKKTLPLVDNEGHVHGLYVWSDVERIMRGNSGLYNVDDKGRLRVAAAVPTSDPEAVERVRAMRKHLDVVVIDSARGDSDFAFKTLAQIKNEFEDLDVMVGNISAADSARELADAGADGIKIGQGPGSICTTRIETGIGIPQVTAVYQCARAASEKDVPVCADGGITKNGDIPVAIAAGAHSIMMGSMLSGTKEAPGEIIYDEDNSRWKLYRGMGSPSAMEDSAASRARYGAISGSKPFAEGVESLVPYKGSVVDILGQMVVALRRGMEYTGARDIEDMRENTNLIRKTSAGMAEARPHDVKVITLRDKPKLG